MAARLAIACRLGLAAVFAVSGLLKLRDAQGFAYDLHLFALTPWALSRPLAFYLPGFEILSALALFIPRLRLGGLLAILGMSAAFSAAIASAWARGLDLSCGCFGHGESAANYPLHLAGTLALAAGAAWLLCREARRREARETLDKAKGCPRKTRKDTEGDFCL